MESEKVKEIKKALECVAKPNALKIELNYKGDLFADILTLINELESENERLNKALVDNLEAYKDGFNEGAGLKKGVDDKLKTENQQLKDRIVERLIEKYGYDKLTHEPDEDIEIHLTASELDETLKELIGEKS